MKPKECELLNISLPKKFIKVEVFPNTNKKFKISPKVKRGFSRGVNFYERSSRHSLDIESYLFKVFPKNLFLNFFNLRKKIYLCTINVDICIDYFFLKGAQRIFKIFNNKDGGCPEELLLVLENNDYFFALANIYGKNRLLYNELLLWFYNENLDKINNEQVLRVCFKINYRKIISNILKKIIKKNKIKCLIGYDSHMRNFLKGNFVISPILEKKESEFISYYLYKLRDKKLNEFYFINIGHCLGEYSSSLVQELARNGLRDFYFLGNAGGLKKSKVNWLHIPKSVSNEDFHIIFFRNIFNVNKNKIKYKKILFKSQHLSVKSPLVETMDYLNFIKNKGFSEVDVELYSILDKIKNFSRINIGIILIISDMPGNKLKNRVLISDQKEFNQSLFIALKYIWDSIYSGH